MMPAVQAAVDLKRMLAEAGEDMSAAATIFYVTRTERTRDAAEAHAIGLCALLNALKAKRA